MRQRIVWVQGSYTIEAVFLMPVLVFLLAFLLQLSIGWYENIQQTAEETEIICHLDTKKYFLNQGELEAILELLDAGISK